MTPETATAGVGPAPDPVPERDVVAENTVPSTERLRSELAACEALIVRCTAIASDPDEPSGAQLAAARTAAFLAQASANAAGAIARLVDAETRQLLAAARLDAGFHRPHAHRRRQAKRDDGRKEFETDWQYWVSEDGSEREDLKEE